MTFNLFTICISTISDLSFGQFKTDFKAMTNVILKNNNIKWNFLFIIVFYCGRIINLLVHKNFDY